jgi:hypothetical protein
MLSDFIPTYDHTYSQRVEKSASLSFKLNFLSLPYLTLGNSQKYSHPPRSTPRFARRFTAPKDSHHYSTRFLRLGERAPNKGDCKLCKKREKT